MLPHGMMGGDVMRTVVQCCDDGEFLVSSATFSESMAFRYTLSRVWDGRRPACCFVMLNPSTADENILDPTVRRCVGFAKAWGYGSLWVLNIFALRATDPEELYRVAFDPVGPHNDFYIREVIQRSQCAVAAWGVHGKLRDRGAAVAAQIHRLIPGGLCCLGMTKDGHPRHPLYVSGSQERVPFTLRKEVADAALGPQPD